MGKFVCISIAILMAGCCGSACDCEDLQVRLQSRREEAIKRNAELLNANRRTGLMQAEILELKEEVRFYKSTRSVLIKGSTMSGPQAIQAAHHQDAGGNPAGGETTSTGLAIRWQNGPTRATNGTPIPPNGAFVETVILAAINRIEHYQASKFACEENARAIDALNEALVHLNRRTQKRQFEGIEGTHAVSGSNPPGTSAP